MAGGTQYCRMSRDPQSPAALRRARRAHRCAAAGPWSGCAGIPLPDDAALVRALAALVTARRLNDQAYALVRQGRLAVYPSSHGQEACQVAAALVLDDGDWLFPTYRDTVAVVARGVDPVEALTPAQGRLALRLRPVRAQGRTAGHAAGHPAAARRRGRPRRHAARRGHRRHGHVRRRRHQRGRLPRGAQLRRRLPGAGRLLRAEQRVRHLACRWPGRPRRRRWRTRASATACPASGSTATTWPRCWPCSARAVDRARAGGGPQLVEAHTYRMQAHTNADDATRYRDDDEVAAWVERDPITRLRDLPARPRPARATSSWPASPPRPSASPPHLRDGLNRDVEPDPADLFAHVYATPTPQLREQAALVADELSREGAR